MNRREALAALMALPATAAVSVAKVAPQDVIVIEYDGVMHSDQIKILYQELRRIWPEPQKIAILSSGLRMKIARHA